mmetsp:Transcript_1316/g.3781  ORF Transcript_1316/g.3781 Transcript_1316/m.3781 type:complete len:241 (+) Transcript_1316:207-929(+)
MDTRRKEKKTKSRHSSFPYKLGGVVVDVLVEGEVEETELVEPGLGDAKGDGDDAGGAADFDGAGDGGAVFDFGDVDLEEVGGALEAVLGGVVERGAGADEGDGQGVFDRRKVPLFDEFFGLFLFQSGERFGQERQVVQVGEDEGTVQVQVLQQMDLGRDGARHVRRVARDLAVALHGVHVAEVQAAALHLARHNQHGAGADSVDVHVAVRSLEKVFGRDGGRVRRADQKRTEVAGVVRVR